MSLLVEAFTLLPPRRPDDDPDLWEAGADAALRSFRHFLRKRYTEGTLCRILASSGDVTARQAAAVALGLIGTMACNTVVAAALHDADDQVRNMASESLWHIWLRGDSTDQFRQLQMAMGLPEVSQRLAACDDLIRTWPEFAEAYNQRAVQHFERGQYSRAVADCERTLQLNPHHFGAAAGMGQCYLRLKKPKAALRAFGQALHINPSLNDLKETIDALKESLGSD